MDNNPNIRENHAVGIKWKEDHIPWDITLDGKRMEWNIQNSSIWIHQDNPGETWGYNYKPIKKGVTGEICAPKKTKQLELF